MNKIKTWWAGIKNKKTIVAIALVVLIVAVALIWWGIASRPQVGKAVFAPTGQLVSGFPKELILDPAAQISGSYAVNYSSSLNQYTASWTSTSSIDDLYNQYLNYFSSRGWTIINSSTAIDGFRGIYAVTSTTDTNVVMNSESGGLNVTISYVKKALMQSAQAAITTTSPVSINAPATVSIQDAKITKQEGNVFTVDFDIANQLGAQPTIKYGVSLIQLKGVSQFVVDTKVYGDTVSLGANDSKHISVTYTAPAFLQGNYFLGIEAENGAGLSLGMAPLGSVTLQGSGKYVNIDESSCFLTVPQDVQATEYNIGQGVDTLLSEDLIAHCDVTNMFGKNVTVTPSFATYYRSVFGAFVASTTQNQITIPSGGAAPESFTVSKAKDPQAYETVLTLLDAQGNPISNSINIDYVVHGESATIQNVVFDKNSYQAGDTAKLSLLWSGPATSFKPRIAAASEGSLTADVQITNAQGASCANSYSQPLGSTGGKTVLNIPIIAQCTNPTAKVALSDAAGNVLASNSFSVESGSGQASGSGLGEAWIYATGLLILIIIAAYFLMKKKKTSSNGGNLIKVLGLLIVIGVSAIVIHAVPASAACPAGGCNNIVCSPNATQACMSATNSCGMTNSGTQTCLSSGSAWGICRDASGNAITAPPNSSCPSATPVFTSPLPLTGATRSCTTVANSCGMTNNQGTQTYEGVDVGWSSCGPVPSNSLCVWCTPGATQTCISAPNTCDLVYAGSETCQANGTWGACNAQVPPQIACETNCVNVAPGTPGQTCISQPNSCGMTNAGVEKCLNNAGKLSPCNIPSTPPSNSECTYQPPAAPTFTLGLNVTLDKTQYTPGAPITVNATFNGLYINGQIVLDTSSFILNGTISGVTAPVLDGAGGIGGGLYFDDPNNPAYLGYNSTYPQYPGLITGTVSSPTWENVAAPGLQPNREEVNVVTDVAYPISNTVTFTAPPTPGSYNAVFTADGNDGFWDKSETITIPYTVIGPTSNLNVYSYLTGGSAMVPAKWNISGPVTLSAPSFTDQATYSVPAGTYTMAVPATSSESNLVERTVYSAVDENLSPSSLSLSQPQSTLLAVGSRVANIVADSLKGVATAYALPLTPPPTDTICNTGETSACTVANACGAIATGVEKCNASNNEWGPCDSASAGGTDTGHALIAPPNTCTTEDSNSLTLPNDGSAHTGNFLILWDPLAGMSVNPSSLTLNSSNQYSGSVTVANTGVQGSVLGWTASTNASWLNISQTSGSLSSGASQNISFTGSATGLTVGKTYTATVAVYGKSTNTADSASVPSQTITVNFTPQTNLSPLSARLAPSTPSGAVSRTEKLTATALGGSGKYNYTFWANCPSIYGKDVATAAQHCNSPIRSGDVTSATTDSVSYTVSSVGTFTPLVVITDVADSNNVASAGTTVTATTAPVINSFTATPSTTAPGQSSTLGWSTTGFTSCRGYSNDTSWGGGPVTGLPKNLTGSQTVTPPATQNYTLTCTDAAGNTASKSVTVTVVSVPTVKLTASPTSIAPGGSTTLTWSSTNTTACVSSDSSNNANLPNTFGNAWDGLAVDAFNKPTKGSLSIAPSKTTTFTITCNGVSDSATVTVTGSPIVTLTPSQNSVAPGGSTTLTWTSQNTAGATPCTTSDSSNGTNLGGGPPSNPWDGAVTAYGGKAANGSISVTLSKTTTFTMTCTGVGGSDTKSVTVTVGSASSAPTVKLTASPTSIAPGGSTTLTWSSTNTTACVSSDSSNNANLPNTFGNAWDGLAVDAFNKPTKGSLSIAPSKTTTFTITCNGVSDSATVTVTSGGSPGGSSLSASLSAFPSSGDAPLTPTLTATATNGIGGTYNYTFWKDCSYSGTSVSDASKPSNCGAPNIKKDGLSAITYAASYTYSLAGTYQPLVIIENGSSAAAAGTTVTVTSPSAPPTPSTVCTPGDTQACTSSSNSCGMTNSGTQTCVSDGSGWSSCSADAPSESLCYPPVSITSFTTSPSTTIVPPESVKLSWTSSGATACSIDQGVSASGTSGSATVAPTKTTTYTLTCTGPGTGSPATQSVTVTVGGVGQQEIPPS